MRTPSILRFLLALALIASPLLADTVVEDIVARVNDQIVTRSEFLKNKEQLLQELKQRGSDGDKLYAEREKDVLRDLIDQDLLLERGTDLGIKGDSETIKHINEMRKQMNLDSMEEMEKAATQQGVSWEDFKEGIRRSIVTQQVIGREVGSHIQPTQQEMQEYYKTHAKDFDRSEEIALSEILVSTEKKEPVKKEGEAAQPAPPATPEEDAALLAAAEKKANDLLAEIKKGEKFETVAKRSSDGPTASQGGDLGFFKKGALSKALEDKTFAMKAGEVTDVIRTKQGFVILKVSGHQTAGIPPLKDIEGQVQEALYLERLQPALRAYLTKLREDAYIDVKSGFVDTGASPNQTKPVLTDGSAASAEKGKLKRKKKLGIL